MHFLKSMLHVPFFILAATLAAADDGCFSSVDTSVSKGVLSFGSQISCSSACGSSYPYIAMKNGGECYCLASSPSSSSATSSSSCSSICYGYGSAYCGGPNAYTVFDNLNYSGSSDGTSSSSASSKSSSSSASKSSSSSSAGPAAGSSSQAASTSVNAGASSSVSQSITNGPSSTLAASASSDPVQYKTVTTTSGSGSTSSATPSSSASASPTNSGNGKKTNIAPIVGGVVGGVAAIALGAAIFFFIRRRNARDEDDEEDFFKKGSSGSSHGGVSRAKSNKINSVFDMPMANPFEHPSDELAEKRASRATVGLTDPRLNPVMMGRKRLSEGSLADEADYSRKILGVMNP